CLSEALADREFIAALVKQVRTTRAWLQRELKRLGFRTWASEGNFVLVDFGDLRPTILAAMISQGIALRNRPDIPGCVRIGIGTQAEIERVVTVLKQTLVESRAIQQVVR